MKIVLTSTIVPFVEGGGNLILDWLEIKLKEYGHSVETIRIPFYPYYPKMIEQMLALRLINVKKSGDRLIAIRTPSYLIKHPNKILWFIHHHRSAYDLWKTKYSDIPDNYEGNLVKQSIISADNIAFEESKKIFTNSKIISSRLKKFNNVESEVLYPPLLDNTKYYCKEYGDYIFYPSRVNEHKRQFLAMEAMKYVKTNVKLIVAGNPDTDNVRDFIKKHFKEYNKNNNIIFIDRWISQKEKVDWLAGALGTIYIPFEEDSYGYVSLESYSSKKPVISCNDSGGTKELIKNNLNGIMTEPDPRLIARAMDTLYSNKKLAQKMGENGCESLSKLNINWDYVIKKLTS